MPEIESPEKQMTRRGQTRFVRSEILLIVNQLRSSYVDVRQIILDRYPQYQTREERARLRRVLDGLTADSNILSILRDLQTEFIKADV